MILKSDDWRGDVDVLVVAKIDEGWHSVHHLHEDAGRCYPLSFIYVLTRCIKQTHC